MYCSRDRRHDDASPTRMYECQVFAFALPHKCIVEIALPLMPPRSLRVRALVREPTGYGERGSQQRVSSVHT